MRAPPLLAALALVAAAACGGGGGHATDAPDPPPVDAPEPAIDAPLFPAFRNPVALDDLTLAQQASQLLGQGAAQPNCQTCHALTRTKLRDWDYQTDGAGAACLHDLSPKTQAAAVAIVDCMRAAPDQLWHPDQIGIDSTAAGLAWFEALFHLAYGVDYLPAFDEWKARVSMPRGAHPTMTQAEFDIVAEWFARNLPHLDDVIPDNPPPPPGCTTDIQAAVATHTTAMQTQGWTAINRDAGILMFGCQGAVTPRDCLAGYPSASAQTWSQGWTAAAPATTIRVLRENSYASSYWTRSSADGRFVAHGGSPGPLGAAVIDLLEDRVIEANAFYDPGFFPDNSGFVIQGGGAHYCRQTLLTSSPAQINFTEPECTTVPGVGLYQHLAAMHGGDYWNVNSQWTGDNGGFGVTGDDPSAAFSSAATTTLIPMIYTGSAFQTRPSVSTPTPSEGDVVLSPSATLLVSRLADTDGTQKAYVLRQLIATPSGSSYTVSAPVIATYCGVHGAKPALSYDERWLVYHHYVLAGDWQSLGYASASDPAFVALRAQGASNVFVLDLTTGIEHRITSMGPGQYALYPHFRSDGWIYILVRDRVRDREYVIASDAALTFP